MDWRTCTRCLLHRTRKKVVLGRGPKPATLLFIGEAPGKNEDLLGVPIVAAPGKILADALTAAARMAGVAVPAYYVTLACACRPCASVEGENRPPTGDELWACFQRLEEECKAVHPAAVVFLGALAHRACRALFPAGVPLQAPAYILRSGGVGCPQWVRFVRSLSQLLRGLENAKEIHEGKGGTVRRWKA